LVSAFLRIRDIHGIGVHLDVLVDRDINGQQRAGLVQRPQMVMQVGLSKKSFEHTHHSG
jgi:hypothetical protein